LTKAWGRAAGRSGSEFILEKKRESDGGLADAAPHYHGHRERLRGRFRDMPLYASATPPVPIA